MVTVSRPYVPGAKSLNFPTFAMQPCSYAAMHLIRDLEAMAGNPFPSRLFAESQFSVPEDLTM